MTFSTLVKRTALLAVLGVAGLCANAQTFAYEGIIYKASGNKLTVQKAGTKVTTGEAGPDVYKGEINVPNDIVFGGKTYHVTSIASAFKGSEITKITLGDDIATIGRGAFQGCLQLTTVKLPANFVKVQGDMFNGCTALTEISIPGKTNEFSSSQFKGCTALRKVIIEDGPEPLHLSVGAFIDGGNSAIEELVINRAISDKYKDVATQPFRGIQKLASVTIGGSFKKIPSSFLENCPALKTVTFTNEPTEMGTNVFAGSGIEEFTMPASLTTVTSSCFMGCKSLRKITLHSAVSSISAMAFYNSTLQEINLVDGLTTIGQMAFSGTNLQGALNLPATLTSVGLQAFANNTAITEVSVPASVTTVSDGAFMGCTSIAKYTVAAENEKYASDKDATMIYTKDGSTLIAFAPKCAATALTGDYTAVAPYAAYGATGLKTVTLDKCVNWGDYAFMRTGISTLSVAGTIGRYVAADCQELTSLVIAGAEVPFGIANNCAKLTDVTFTDDLTTVKQDAFNGCTALKSLDLGKILAIIEANAFANCGITNLKVTAANPASMAEGVFTAEMNGITVTVPVDLVDAYKKATGWSYLNIVGDANLAAGPADMGMPNGLYFASPDGNLYCAYDEQDGKGFDKYDVGGVPHTFQLLQFKNRIYGASAGNKFVYSATGAVDGDGKLFYISKVGGQTFQAVVLDNAGGNAYKDPFGLYIYGDTLFVNDRNVCIRKIAADAIALPQNYQSWVENNWLGYYGSPWTYGCIKSGWAITKTENDKGEEEPLYWVGMKYNGNGIYRFKDEHVGSANGAGAKPENNSFLTGSQPIFTTFYVDEANNHMYIYMERCGSGDNYVKGGLYRVNIEKMEAMPEPTNFINDWQALLIDGSPVKFEGSATNEHVGISQLSPDEKGEYLYWCYRAPTKEEAEANEAQDFAAQSQSGKYWWADKYNENNPLHQTGIKRIKLGEANPTVDMVVPGAEGYGVVPVNYTGSKRPAAVADIIAPAAKADITISGDALVANSDATVAVYDMAGTMVAAARLKAGEAMSLSHLNAGAYIATANGAAVKFVK